MQGANVLMEVYEILNMIVSIIYTSIQFTLVVLMYKKIKQTGSRELVYLSAVFFMMGAVALFMPFKSLFIAILQPFSATLLLPFIKATFYKQKRSWYKPLLAITTIVHVIVVLLKLSREWFKQVLFQDPPELFLAYNIAMFVIFGIAFGWLAVLCLRTRSRLARSRAIESWIVARYDLVALSAILILAGTSIPLFFHEDMVFHSGIIPKLVLGILFLGFSITSFFAWFMPGWAKRFFNRMYPEKIEPGLMPGQPGVDMSTTRRLDTTKMAAIIDYLGDRLSMQISKSPAAAKGLLFMALDTETAILKNAPLDLASLQEAIMVELTPKLAALGFENAAGITSLLADDLKENQSLILMQFQ